MKLCSACIDGIDRYRPSMSNEFKLELLNEYRELLEGYDELMSHEMLMRINLIKGSTDMIRSLETVDFHWIYDVYKSLNQLIWPYIYEGSLIYNNKEEQIISISMKCYNLKYLESLDSLFKLLEYKGITISDYELISHVIKNILNVTLVIDEFNTFTILSYVRLNHLKIK